MTLAALSGLLGFAFGLRIYDLGTPTFWFDEAVSAFIANKGLIDIIAYTRSQPFEHPPFYYLLLSLWIMLAGKSEFALRFFSLFWGLLFPPLLYRFTRRFLDSQVAFWATVIALFSPFALAYSREARMYTLVMLLSLLSVYLWLQAVESNGAAWWAAYVSVSLIGLGTHYYFSLVILAEILFMAWRWRQFRQAVGRFALCQACMAVPLVLWLLSSSGPSISIKLVLDYGLLAQRDMESVIRAYMDLTFGNVVFRPLNLADYSLSLGLLIVLLMGMLLWPCAKIVPLEKNPRIAVDEVWFFVVLFLVVTLLAAFIFPYRLASRYLSCAFVSICILLALGIIWLQQKGPLTLGVGLLLLGPVFVYGAQNNMAFAKSKYGVMIREVNAKGQAGDGIILNGPGQWPLFGYYYRGYLPHYYVPKTGPHYYAGDFPRIYLPISEAVPSDDQEMAHTLEAILTRHPRVWLVMSEAWAADPENKVERWLNQHAYQASKMWFGNDIQLAVYFAPGTFEAHPGPQVTFEEQLRLKEYRISPGPVAAGDAIRLDLVWQAMRPLDRGYLVSLRLVDAAGHIWAEKVADPQGGYYPTTDWQVGEQVADKQALSIPPGTPPGRYMLQLGIYDLDQRKGLALLDEKRSPQGLWLNLGTIQVVRPQVPPSEEALGIPRGQRLGTRFANGLLLLGYITKDNNQPQWVLKQGESRTMTLYWRALTKPESDLALLARLLDNSGQSRWQQAFPLGGPDYPTSGWAEGEVVKAQYDLLIPADLEGRDYRLQVAVQDLSTGRLLPAHPPKEGQGLLAGLFSWSQPAIAEYVELARVRVEGRQRRFVVPPIQYPAEADLAHQIKFLGYDLSASRVGTGETLRLTLYWQALEPMSRSYKVFTHLTDGQGKILAQHDSIPANWTLPTTGWARGEVIVDEHEIPIKPDVLPGAYILSIGLYDPITGQRLPVYNAQGQPEGERIVLTEVEIVGSR